MIKYQKIIGVRDFIVVSGDELCDDKNFMCVFIHVAIPFLKILNVNWNNFTIQDDEWLYDPIKKRREKIEEWESILKGKRGAEIQEKIRGKLTMSNLNLL